MTEYCCEKDCSRIADWRFDLGGGNWVYSCAAHLGSMKHALSTLGKIGWSNNHQHLVE
jgi:hypothetical protein